MGDFLLLKIVGLKVEKFFFLYLCLRCHFR